MQSILYTVSASTSPQNWKMSLHNDGGISLTASKLSKAKEAIDMLSSRTAESEACSSSSSAQASSINVTRPGPR